MALTSSRSLNTATDSWRAVSSCRDTDPDLFFPVGTTGPALEQIAAAKAVCDSCEAKSPCLEFALTTNQDSGVWGGTSEEERRKLRRAWVAQQRRASRCGLTSTGSAPDLAVLETDRTASRHGRPCRVQVRSAHDRDRQIDPCARPDAAAAVTGERRAERDRAVELRHQTPHDRQAQAGGLLRVEIRVDADAVVDDGDVQRAAAAGPARSRPGPTPPAPACRSGTRGPRRSAAARSAPPRATSPPVRAACRRRRVMAKCSGRSGEVSPSSTIRTSGRTISPKSTSSPSSRDSVSCTSAIERMRRTDSSIAALADGSVSRRPCSRNSDEIVCRLFLTRWWISLIVASLETSRRSRLRSSETSRNSTTAPSTRPLSSNGMHRSTIETSSRSTSSTTGCAVKNAR